MKQLILKPGREKSLARRHPWIFSGAVARVQGDPDSGDTVAVRAASGEFLVWAAYSPASQIRARAWSWDEQERIDGDFLRARLRRALDARERLISAEASDAMRIVHGESDGLPGIIADRYGGVVVLQLFSSGAERWRTELAEGVRELTGCACAFERSDADVRELEGLPARSGVLHGTLPAAGVQIREHGLRRSQLTLSDTMVRTVIREYTREAGVRNLERRIADICRKAATQVAKGQPAKPRVDDKRLREWLGARRFSGEVRKRTSVAGVATGLAYTAAGGDVLFIEAAAYPGKGRLTVTGQLGDVMQESAQTAHSWVRSHAAEVGLPENWFEEHDVHVHVPAGAVPKDGPSAGVTMATAIASLVRGEPVSADVGMTGEITLSGQVLPIGGLREKSLAAQRAGLKRVIFPRENTPDLDELPPETRKAIEFIPADTIEDVFAGAFGGKRRVASRRPQSVERAAARAS